MTTILDPEQLAKEQGMSLAASVRPLLLRLAQDVAERLAQERGVVTADDVFEWLEANGHKPSALGNAAGLLFRGPQWEPCGFTESRRKGNHRRMIRQWRIRS